MKDNLHSIPVYFRHLTPPGKGGISTFLLCGQNNENFVANYFQSFNGKFPTLENGRFFYGKLFNNNRELIDEIILTIQNENQMEIHSHGGNISTREIIKFLKSISFLPLPESVFQLYEPYYHYHHSLKNIATINDYEFIRTQIKNFQHFKNQTVILKPNEIIILFQKMIVGWNQEKMNRRRANICLAGLPNAGKSSLINSITGKKRALVSKQAKTTRDTITENFQTQGFRLNIIDTAGLHHPDNYLDSESIKQTFLHIEKAEILLWLHDCTTPFTTDEKDYLKKNSRKPFHQTSLAHSYKSRSNHSKTKFYARILSLGIL